jgi:hypothetical protein
LDEKIQLEHVMAEFRSSLSVSDRAVFDSGHRLSSCQRDMLLSKGAPADMRFSDEAVSTPSPPPGFDTVAAAKERCRVIARSPPRTAFRSDIFLMMAWHIEDPLTLEFIVDFISHGANMAFDGPRSASKTPVNMPSAAAHRKDHIALIEKGMANGEIMGWFSSPPFFNLRVHPSGVVPKDDNGWRFIENFSYPAGSSVNDHTERVHMAFDRIDQAINSLFEAGEGCFMIVFD